MIGSLSFACLLVVGFAVLWAVNLVYRHGSVTTWDYIGQILVISGWLLILLGLLGVVIATIGAVPSTAMGFVNTGGVFVGAGFLLWLLGLVLAAMIFQRFSLNERRAFLWYLSAAARHEIPLARAAAAVAVESNHWMARRARVLANYLQSAVPLVDALRLARIRLPLTADLALRMHGDPADLSFATSNDGGDDFFENILQPLVAKAGYLLFALITAVLVFVFISLKIWPAMIAIGRSMGLTAPAPIAIMNGFYSSVGIMFSFGWFLFVFLTLGGFGLLFLHYVGWISWEPPVVRRLWLRYHGAQVMRVLAREIERDKPLVTACKQIALQYPRRHVRSRMEKIVAVAQRGGNWQNALRQAGLISSADEGVLQTAERLGHLAWALREMAASSVRRLHSRLNAGINFSFFVVILLFSVPVVTIALSVFMPLVQYLRAILP